MLGFDPWFQPYSSIRNTTFARNGMVATSQPLAAEAGMEMLKKGGNAIDAAIATAVCLTVVEPTGNGIGGDAFALVWIKGALYGLNASGPAPASLSIDELEAVGHDEMPMNGWYPVTVPGAPAAWIALSRRFGRLPFADLFKPAISYAEEGYPLTPTLGRLWRNAYDLFKNELQEDQFANWCATFAHGDRAPRVGEVWSSNDHAGSLREIAATQSESFYQGGLAKRIASYAWDNGGYLTANDLAVYDPEWVEPIHTTYRGYDVWEIPPNGQGLVTLEALNILSGFEFSAKDSVETYHKQIEAIKLAFSDGLAYITDRQYMQADVDALISDSYAQQRRALISDTAMIPEAGKPQGSSTVYLATADSEGNMVSFIQSNYRGFGSGLVVPGTGIALQNRGANFSLDRGHDNALAPGKRPFHTIIPGFLTKAEQAIGPFGVMGGFIQPQAHMQMVMNTVDFHLNPQASLDAPRWQWVEGKKVMIEQSFPNAIAKALADRGHDIRVAADSINFGRGQIIWRDPGSGVLAGGTEPRTDGAIAAW